MRRSVTVQSNQPCLVSSVRGEQGVAMLTVLMVMLMMTVLGIGALTVSGLENNIAGLQRTAESAAQAAESGLGTSTNVLLQTLLPENGNQIPAELLSTASPAGPVPVGNKTVFEGEIIGNPENLNDTPSSVPPNISMTVGAYAVACDVDRLYVKMRAGTGQQQFAAYDGAGVGAGSNGVDVYFKIDCVASNTATGTESRVTAVYACALTGDGCQKQL